MVVFQNILVGLEMFLMIIFTSIAFVIVEHVYITAEMLLLDSEMHDVEDLVFL